MTRTHAPAPMVASIAAFAAFVALAAGLIAAQAPIIVVLGCLTLVFGIAAILRPEAVAFLVIGLLYSNAAVVAVTVHGVPAFAAVAVPLALGIPFAYNVSKGRPIVLPPATGWLMVYTGVQLVGVIASSDQARSWGEFEVFLLEGLCLYVAIYNTVRTRQQLKTAAAVVAGVAAAVAALSIFQWVTQTYDQDYYGFAQRSEATVRLDEAGTERQPRISGPVGEKNRFAQVLAVAAPMALALGWVARSRSRQVLWAAAFMAILVATALTYSRGGAVGLGIVLVVALVLRKARPRSIVLLVGGVIAVLMMVPGYRDRLASLETVGGAAAPVGEEGETDTAIRGRVTQNIAAFQVFADHPIIGVGPGMFPVYYPQYAADIGIRPRLIERESHNLLLGIASDSGLIGLISFCGFNLAIARQLWRRHRRGDAVATGFLLALLAYQTTGVFLHLSYARYYWLMMALAAVAAMPADAPAPVAPQPRPLVHHG